MGAEESTQRDPPCFLNASTFEAVLSRNSGVSQSCRRSSRPSVSEFSNNPEKYPDFVLVLVLSTGKMEVMTRLEARSSAEKVKVVVTPNNSGSSDNSSFFRRSSDDDTILYFEPTTGKLGTRKKEDRHRRSDNSSGGFRRSSDDDPILYFDPATGKLGTRKKEDRHRSSDTSSGGFRRSYDEDTILYFDPTTGKIGTRKEEVQHRRDGLIWLG